MAHTETGAEWPSTAAPHRTPSVVWYFSELHDGVPSPPLVTNFVHPWQLGTFLKQVFDGAEVVVSRDDPKVVDYELPGGVEFRGRIVGCTVADALAQARAVAMPRHERMWVQWSRGVHRAVPEPDATTPEPAPRPPREPATPRVARSTSAVTLAALCAEHKVEPKAVRVELRKAKMERPAAGWEFEANDPRIGQTIDIIKGMKQ